MKRATSAAAVALVLAAAVANAAMNDDLENLKKGRADLTSGNLFRAASTFRLVARETEERELRGEALLLAAVASYRSGRNDRALEHIQAFMAEFPADPRLRSVDPGILTLAGLDRQETKSRVEPAYPVGTSLEGLRALLKPAVAAPFNKVDDRHGSTEIVKVVDVAPPAPPAAERPIPPAAETVRPVVPSAAPEPVRTESVRRPAAPREQAQTYAVQVLSSFDEKKIAEQVSRLRAMGLDPVHVVADSRATEMNRLLQGRYRNQVEAERVRQRLKKTCGTPFIAVDSGDYCVFTGSFVSPESAKAEKLRLAAKGIRVEVVKARVALPVWRMKIGSYRTAEEAETIAETLRGKGFSAAVALE